MAKVLLCKDLGTDCDFVARGETEEELFKVVVEHGAQVHGMTDVPPEMIEKAKSLIKDE